MRQFSRSVRRLRLCGQQWSIGPIIVVVALAFVIYRCIPSVSAGNMRSYIVSGICALLLSLTLIVPGQWSEGQESSTGYRGIPMDNCF